MALSGDSANAVTRPNHTPTKASGGGRLSAGRGLDARPMCAVEGQDDIKPILLAEIGDYQQFYPFGEQLPLQHLHAKQP